MVLGPTDEGGRVLDLKGPFPGVSVLHVSCDEQVMWSANVRSYCHSHNPNQSPVAVHITDTPESLEDTVKKMIQSEFLKWAFKRQEAEEEPESYEDSEDFETYEDDEFITPYEFHDLEEEAVEFGPEEPPVVSPGQTKAEDPPVSHSPEENTEE
jgi:hypothetical protein